MSSVLVVDTSVWIAQFAGRGPDLSARLDDERVHLHEFILGELVLGTIPRGHPSAALLSKVPRVATLSHDETIEFVRLNRLEGSGIGWSDAHILASVVVSGAALWTLDKPLRSAANELGVAV